jgi:hypothetical protein
MFLEALLSSRLTLFAVADVFEADDDGGDSGGGWFIVTVIPLSSIYFLIAVASACRTLKVLDL